MRKGKVIMYLRKLEELKCVKGDLHPIPLTTPINSEKLATETKVILRELQKFDRRLNTLEKFATVIVNREIVEVEKALS